MGDPTGGCDPREEAHQPHPSIRISDRTDELVEGTSVEENPEAVDKGAPALHREPPREREEILLRHSSSNKLCRVFISEAVDLAGGGQVRGETENLWPRPGEVNKGLRIGFADEGWA